VSGFISSPYVLTANPIDVPTDQLTHRWPMTAATFSGGSVIDVVGSLNGTAGSSVALATGPSGGANTALTIPDDANGYITLAGAPQGNLTAAWSIGVWIKRADYSTDTFQGAGTDARPFCFFDGSNAVNMGNPAPARGQMEVGFVVGPTNKDIRSSIVLTNAVWSHLVYVWDTSAAKLYINGALDGSATVNLTINGTPSNDNTLGARALGLRPWGGDMHNVCFYSKALSAAEVTQLFGAQ
jgi:Concanavalin A-like lectin/glucanases superfamily